MNDADDLTGYCYPSAGDDPDRFNVLRNKFNLRSHSALQAAEYRATDVRTLELIAGEGPRGSFGQAHLKALHGYIFQDVYEWAGRTRDQTPVVDGNEVQPIGMMSKGGDAFLPGAQIQMGFNDAFRPIRDPEILRGLTVSQFAEKAGTVLSDLNYVHPFREGNGRTQEAFVRLLGCEYGYDVRFAVITKPRMIDASRETSANPANPAIIHLVEDATDPGRRAAIQSAFASLRAEGEDPMEHTIRSARAGETITGTIFARDDHHVTLVTDAGIIVADREDLPRRLPPSEQDITFEARSEFSRDLRPSIAASPAIADPTRTAVIAHLSDVLQRNGIDPKDMALHTPGPGERADGTLLVRTGLVAAIIDAQNRTVIVASRDLPELSRTGEVSLVVQTPIASLAAELAQNRETPSIANDRGELAKSFLTLNRADAERVPALRPALAAFDRLTSDLDREFYSDDPNRAVALDAGRKMIADDLEHGREHSSRLSEKAIERGLGPDRGIER